MTKTEDARSKLRIQIRHARNALTNEQQEQAALQVGEWMTEFITSGMHVAFYLGNDGELSPHLAIQKARELGAHTLLPVLHPLRKGYLNFQHYHVSSEFAANRYGIPEPKMSALETVPLANIDIIFMPLVAFDKDGNRLGMGGGYYDRTLSKLSELANPPKLIGLAHDVQQVDSLPFQPWDVPIELILTPTKQIRPSTSP